MRTNVILKSGVSLCANVVNVYSVTVFVYIHNLLNIQRIELMNLCLQSELECVEEDTNKHPNALRISIPKKMIEQFSIASL